MANGCRRGHSLNHHLDPRVHHDRQLEAAGLAAGRDGGGGGYLKSLGFWRIIEASLKNDEASLKNDDFTMMSLSLCSEIALCLPLKSLESTP